MIKRLIVVVLGAVALSLLMTTVALAATPQDIYDDYADNGVLDGEYTDDDLCAYLNDATIHEYGDKTITERLDDLVKDACSRDTFPFTGFQLMMAGIVAVVLIGGGLALRHFSRPRTPSEKS